MRIRVNSERRIEAQRAGRCGDGRRTELKVQRYMEEVRGTFHWNLEWPALGCGNLGEEFWERNMEEKQVPPGQVQIKADEKEMQGLYSNLVMIQHHAEEFTLNFVYIFPNGTQGKLL